MTIILALVMLMVLTMLVVEYQTLSAVDGIVTNIVISQLWVILIMFVFVFEFVFFFFCVFSCVFPVSQFLS